MLGKRWRDIEGYLGIYAISNTGQLYSYRSNRILSPVPDTYGYIMYRLIVNRVRVKRMAHQLVAEAFIGPCPTDHEVNHKNGKKDDNRKSNLEYLTRLENMRHAHRNGLIRHRLGEDSPNAKLSNKEIVEIRSLYWNKVFNQYQLAGKYGISQGYVSELVNNSKRVKAA